MMWWLWWACWFEEVTGEPVPLDPRFYEAVEKAQGDPGKGGGSAVPFSSTEGPRVKLRGTLAAPSEEPIDLDLRSPDPEAPGGMRNHGKLLIDGPGPFELEVPQNFGRLQLEAFQDLASDGPSPTDPFAQADLTVEGVDVEGIALELKAGARPGAGGAGGAGGPVHQEMPPGAPGGGGQPGGPGGVAAPQSDPFAGSSGPTVRVSGIIGWEGQGVVDLDLFQPDFTSGGGRRLLGKLKLAPGPYEFQVPVGFGPLILEAFIDVDSNGPSAADPSGGYPSNPLVVGQQSIEGVDITLKLVGAASPPTGDSAPAPPAGAPNERVPQ
jgi:hypothetical protein